MSMFPNSYQRPVPLEYGTGTDVGILARFFNTVYAWMAAGLALTAAVAWWTSTQPQLVRQIHTTGLWIVLAIVELVLVFIISAAIRRIGPAMATVLFMLFAAINGLVLSIVLLVYAQALIASAFFVTAGTFAATSVYGFVTSRDLTSLARICSWA